MKIKRKDLSKVKFKKLIFSPDFVPKSFTNDNGNKISIEVRHNPKNKIKKILVLLSESIIFKPPLKTAIGALGFLKFILFKKYTRID
jgi:hypothetical protein